MLFNATHVDRLNALTAELEVAPTATPELFRRIAADACIRLPVLARSGKTSRIDKLIDAGAWNDAALTLIEFELPAWKLRRLVFEDGEWFCSLSKQPNLPVGFDDTADFSHEIPALAILGAFLEARRRTEAAHSSNGPTVPQSLPALRQWHCCDNFA
jgi:hypothetical protein